MELQNKMLTDEQFEAIRKEVLATWPTGAEVDFDEAVEYHKNMLERNVAKRLARARSEGDTLIQPRSDLSCFCLYRIA